MSCVLHISGLKFDVDAFVVKSKLRPYKVFYKGEARVKTKPNGVKSARSGLALEVSKAEMDDVKGQIKDAVRFLTRNQEKLRQIPKTNGIQHAILDFGMDRKIDGDKHMMESHLLPGKLLQLAGEFGLSIQLTFYAENMQTVLEERMREKDMKMTQGLK
jgi:hypothetical protein